MQKRRCRACRRMFVPKAQVPGQCFCVDEPCQQERRRRWQKKKRHSDADYRDNERRAQRTWAARHPRYWKEYRREHPEYDERNRRHQRDRDRRRRAENAAQTVLANEDVWRVQIAVLPRS